MTVEEPIRGDRESWVLGMVASTAEVGRGSRAGEKLHLLHSVYGSGMVTFFQVALCHSFASLLSP
jgi:hypothetical protein